MDDARARQSPRSCASGTTSSGSAEPNDFEIRNLAEMQDAARQSTQTMAVLLGGVALISLIVGAIGIANVMLVSVTERTREIGMRMAVGAPGRDMLFQFLTEAVALAMRGRRSSAC